MSTVPSEIRSFIVTNFMFGQGGSTLTDEQSLLESGVIDSTGLLELVSFVEERFGIVVSDHELLPENLDSIQNLTRYIDRKQAPAPAGQ